MLKSILKASGYVACLAWSGMVWATGLGGINVSSNLGQPLKAEIELVAVDKADRSSISAKLASADAFKSAGIDYPYSLPKLKFEVVNRDSGEPYVKVTSVQAINEPFVTLLVELTWSSGKLLREYTFLLDPVDFVAPEPKVAAVRPIAPAAPAPAAPAPAPVAPQVTEVPPAPVAPAAEAPTVAPAAAPATSVPEAIPQAAPAPQPVVAEPAQLQATPAAEQQPAAAEEAAPATEEAAGVEEEAAPEISGEENPFLVVPGDTLSAIALNVKPADVSLERMLVAMYRANPDLFVGKNMNRLKTGKIIRIPDATEVDAIEQSEAVKVVRAHTADWNAYRQQLAAVHAEPVAQEGRQESSGKVSAAVAERTLPGKEAPKEVLKLSKGEAPTDKIVGGGKATTAEQVIAKEEEAIAKSKALKEAQERTALLEKNVSDLKRLADMKQSGAVTQSGVPAASAATAAGAAGVSQVAAASHVAPAPKKVPVPAPVPVPVQEPSFLDSLPADPVMLAGGAALLVVLGGVGLILARRRRAGTGEAGTIEEVAPEEIGGATGRMAAPVAPSPETGDFTQAAASEAPVQNREEEVDPIGEADLFLTFGRDAQAEEVLKEALKTNPGHVPVKLKLLSIYSSRKDTKSFYTYAREIKDSGDENAWNQAASMGRELEPSNPFYGGTGASAAPVAEQKAEAPAVDFDLGFGAAAAPAAEQTMVVAEVPPQETTAVMSQEEFRAVQETPMDFDVTGVHGGEPATQSPEATVSVNMDEMVFDVTTTHPGAPAMTAGAAPAPAQAESVLGDLVFDITSSHAEAPAATAPVAPAPAVDEGLTFTLDFPSELAAAPKAAEKPLDIGLGDISLNLEGLTPPAATTAPVEAKSEQWQEVATKLDLAKAYQEMGDAAGAKEILDEVQIGRAEQQRAAAQAMIQQM